MTNIKGKIFEPYFTTKDQGEGTGFGLAIVHSIIQSYGGDLAKELLNINPQIPVILCTGFSNKINEKKAKEIGISSFIMKPIILKNMAKAIRDVLDKK